MKRVLLSLTLSAIVIILGRPALAQSTQPVDPTPHAVQSEEAQNALYQKFVDSYKTDQPMAFKVAKEYLQKYAEENEQTKYLKMWVDVYNANAREMRKSNVIRLFQEGRFEEAFALGSEILESEPEDIGMLYVLVDGGLFALNSGNNAFRSEAIKYAKRALELIESGRVAPQSDGKILGKLYFLLGMFSLSSAPAESTTHFSKAMQFEDFKRDPLTYAFLADAILGSRYLPLREEYESTFPTLEQKLSAQARPLTTKLNKAKDLIINSLARAITLAGSDARLESDKARWMEALTRLYKSRNNGYETGLNEYIESVLTRPFPFLLLQN